jgi:hypothetical protein
MPEENSRKAFEAWIMEPPFEASIVRYSQDAKQSAWPGQYLSYPVQLAWEAWQAASQQRKELKL